MSFLVARSPRELPVAAGGADPHSPFGPRRPKMAAGRRPSRDAPPLPLPPLAAGRRADVRASGRAPVTGSCRGGGGSESGEAVGPIKADRGERGGGSESRAGAAAHAPGEALRGAGAASPPGNRGGIPSHRCVRGGGGSAPAPGAAGWGGGAPGPPPQGWGRRCFRAPGAGSATGAWPAGEGRCLSALPCRAPRRRAGPGPSLPPEQWSRAAGVSPGKGPSAQRCGSCGGDPLAFPEMRVS